MNTPDIPRADEPSRSSDDAEHEETIFVVALPFTPANVLALLFLDAGTVDRGDA